MGVFGTCPPWWLEDRSEGRHRDCPLERESREERESLQDPQPRTPDSRPAETVTVKTTTPVSPRAAAGEGTRSPGPAGGCSEFVFRMLHLHPVEPRGSFPAQRSTPWGPCTCLDSIFGGQIEIWLWGVPGAGDVLSDPSWFGGLEGWQEFALGSGAVGREDDWGLAEAWRAGAGAGGPQWGGPAGDPGAVLIAPQWHPSELQAGPGYVADTRAAGRAGQRSICGRQGRPPLTCPAAGTWRSVLSIYPLYPDSLQTPRNLKTRFSKHGIQFLKSSPFKYPILKP